MTLQPDSALLSRCAWCMTEAERAAQPAGISHGICPDCLVRVLRDYQATKDVQ